MISMVGSWPRAVRLSHWPGLPDNPTNNKEALNVMAALLLGLILIAILFGAGAALHALWWVAVIALVLWLIGFVARPRGGRWYYW